MALTTMSEKSTAGPQPYSQLRDAYSRGAQAQAQWNPFRSRQ